MRKDFVCQEDNDHKIWRVLPIIWSRDVSHRLIFEKSSHLSVASPVKEAFLSAIQADLSFTPFFTMRYAWMYSSQE